MSPQFRIDPVALEKLRAQYEYERKHPRSTPQLVLTDRGYLEYPVLLYPFLGRAALLICLN